MHAQTSPAYSVVEAFPNLTFKRPTDLQSARDGSHRLFLVEQDGVIRVFNNAPGVKTSAVFLDLRSRVDHSGNEMGMLGLAFHSDFGSHPEFFVDYTASWMTANGGMPEPILKRITRVSRFTAPAKQSGGIASSEEAVIEIDQPYTNHNGGQVAFGPDGMLYIALGDGGSAGDPQGNAQNVRALLGKLLRIDVSKKPYAIPPDNPFAPRPLVATDRPESARGEIYAYGLRNPWRFSFDRATGQLWTGDVGQNTYEEIDIIEKGKNYGWDCREAAHAFQPASQQCDLCKTAHDLVDPVWEYGRTQGISVTGGYVYRGKALPDLVGWYVYADYGSGNVWALRMENGKAVNRLLANAHAFISTFGVDENDEIYLCAHDPSDTPTKILKLVAN
ncbi:MAG TPA: PQQ-dependent sugar dehydrogenase [Candidatus Krumholzibacteria bacterium]|nr:PQQ-dependent sugar dehydrogenase [Candidatus Krumholzibacteria bacterium]